MKPVTCTAPSVRTALTAATIALMLGTAPAVPASADVTPIDEFAGEASETFENIEPPGGYTGPVDIFGGAGAINDLLANTLVIALNVGSSETDFEELYPYHGNLMGLTPTGWAAYTFDPPVHRVGGFIGSAAIQEGGSVQLFDESNALLAEFDLDLPPLKWTWYGWESDTPIARVEVRGSSTPGDPLVFDQFQIAYDAATVPGDLDGDGEVNVTDLLELLAVWGPCGDVSDCPADLTGDEAVDVADLLELLANWN